MYLRYDWSDVFIRKSVPINCQRWLNTYLSFEIGAYLKTFRNWGKNSDLKIVWKMNFIFALSNVKFLEGKKFLKTQL